MYLRPVSRRRLLWALSVGVGAAFLIRLFWLREYPVRSGSMEPTIFGSEENGEYVLVAFGSGRGPRRFDLVVVRVEDRPEPLVKRVVGLPSESVKIRDGDLFIDGKLLPPDYPRPAPILVFDDRFLDVASWFQMGSTDRDPWTHSDGEWLLEAGDVPRGSNGGMMFLSRELLDGYLTPEGVSVAGLFKVHDAIVGCDVMHGDPQAVIRLGLHEKGDTFEVVLEPSGPDEVRARLTRLRAEHPLEELAAAILAFERERWHSLCFSNVDDSLAFELDGCAVLNASYDGNVPHPTELEQQPIRWQSYGHRVSLGGEAGRARFRRIRVWRDLHYTAQGEYAVRGPLQLGRDEVFVLGDCSSRSVDGRVWGPNRLDSVVGRPLCVAWPISRMRILEGAEEPRACATR